MLQYCPCCASPVSDFFELEYSGLGESVFNGRFPMLFCRVCGLVFNGRMHELDLEKFYTSEGFYCDLEHFDPTNPANVTRNTFFYNIILQKYGENATVADIGCGNGSFAKFLHSHSKMSVAGVDFEAETQQAPDGTGPAFHNGSAVCLPFSSNSIDILTYFHVLEHVPDLDSVCEQAYAVLAEGGLLLIEVPDAERYSVVAGADAHWYASREHVHHFTRRAIRKLLERHGFIVEDVSGLVLPMATFNGCSLLALARKKNCTNLLEPIPATSLFFVEMQKKLQCRAEELRKICARYDSVVVWGLGSVFFSIMPFLYESIKDILILVDSSPYKQKMTYRHTPLSTPESVIPTDNTLCITGSTISHTSIRNAALRLGWKPENIIPIYF